MLVIASRGDRFDKLINDYWSKFINYIKAKNITTIKIFLIFGNDVETSDLNLSEDDKLILNIPESWQPGILNKTISAFTIINNSYTYKHIIRTNLSSFFILDNVIRISDELKNTDVYTGVNGLYEPFHEGIPLHEGIPFISGACMWLSSDNIKYIIDNQSSLDKKLPDDVAIGKLLINTKKGILKRYDLTTDNEIIDKITLFNDIINNNHYHIRIKSGTEMEIDINYMNKFTEIMYKL
jgi:hypothetical protein